MTTEQEMVVYVDASKGDDANDGLTPERAKRTLEAASKAINHGTLVVAPGTHSTNATVNIKDNVFVRGVVRDLS